MKEHLEQQLINELRSLIKPINEKYKEFFHIQLITLCDMKDMACTGCKSSDDQKCRRCVIGFEEFTQ